MRLKRRLGLLALTALRALGGFEIARRLTARRLRILCYHGFSVADEHRFRAGMWIRGNTFERRIAFLKRGGYPVLPLDEALERMEAGTLPPAAVVVTIDDGFAGTLPVAVPVLQKFDAPATLYLTTYYTLHQDPVFDLAVAYLLCKADVETLDTRALGVPELAATVPWRDAPAAERDGVVSAIVRHGHAHLGRAERTEFLERLACAARVPLEPIMGDRRFHLLTEDEVRELSAAGVDVQLHTHRHATPTTAAAAAAELAENRAHIVRLTGREPRHFCYPSGRADEWDPQWLAAGDVRSATTTTPGHVDASTPRYQLSRFNDGECVPQVMFEAEISGVLEIVRAIRARWGHRPLEAPAARAPRASSRAVLGGAGAHAEVAVRGLPYFTNADRPTPSASRDTAESPRGPSSDHARSA